MRFLLDMGIAQRIGDWLRNHEHDAVHLADQGLQKLPDSNIFQKADKENRIIVTFDLDFGEIAAFSSDRFVTVLNRSWFCFRSIKGSHHVYYHPETKRVIVPHHSKELPRGTLMAILKQAGIDFSG